MSNSQKLLDQIVIYVYSIDFPVQQEIYANANSAEMIVVR